MHFSYEPKRELTKLKRYTSVGITLSLLEMSDVRAHMARGHRWLSFCVILSGRLRVVQGLCVKAGTSEAKRRSVTGWRRDAELHAAQGPAGHPQD